MSAPHGHSVAPVGMLDSVEPLESRREWEESTLRNPRARIGGHVTRPALPPAPAVPAVQSAPPGAVMPSPLPRDDRFAVRSVAVSDGRLRIAAHPFLKSANEVFIEEGGGWLRIWTEEPPASVRHHRVVGTKGRIPVADSLKRAGIRDRHIVLIGPVEQPAVAAIGEKQFRPPPRRQS